MNQNLIDKASFAVKGGDGGDGIIHFRREKYEPKGGPDGGDGGKGGSVWIEATESMKTLRYYAGRHEFAAKRGGHGGKKQQTGHDGEDVILHVPIGTVIKVKTPSNTAGRQNSNVKTENDKWQTLADLDKVEMRVCAAKGGRGGRGNTFFKGPANTTPREAERGEVGARFEILLELKVLADVGLVGLPNAGKSTLLSVLTAARPVIADYPFTTLSPNLGVMVGGDPSTAKQRTNALRAPTTAEATAGRQDDKSDLKSVSDSSSRKDVVIADIPGLIEDAHKGKGLGMGFLKHVERCGALLYVLYVTEEDLIKFESQNTKSETNNDVSNSKYQTEIAENIYKQYETVKHEVESYGHGLAEKQSLVVVNKMDLVGSSLEFQPKALQSGGQADQPMAGVISDQFRKKGIEVLLISAATGEGLGELKQRLMNL